MPDRAYGVRHACGFYGSVGRGLGTRGGTLPPPLSSPCPLLTPVSLPLAFSGAPWSAKTIGSTSSRAAESRRCAALCTSTGLTYAVPILRLPPNYPVVRNCIKLGKMGSCLFDRDHIETKTKGVDEK